MKLLTTILFTLIFQGAFATNFYFSSLGNDLAAGTIAAPWKSTAKFNSVFASKAPGDSFLFRRGDTFYGNLVLQRSGAVGNPIVIGAYGVGANPIITGLSTVANWTSLGGNIWESILPVSSLSSLNLVLINGVNTAMGRFPNSGYLPYQTYSFTTKTSTSLTGVPNWMGAEIVARKNNWIIDRDIITSQSGGTITHTSVSPYDGIANYGFFIQNDVRTLDAQNEWYYIPSTKKLRLYSTVMPSNVQISTIDTLVYTKQKDYITFDHIDLIGSNKDAFIISGSNNLTIQYCTLDFHGKDAVWGANNFGSPFAPNLIFQYNTVNHINNDGIILADEFTNAYIGHNTFKNIGLSVGMGGNGADLSNGTDEAVQVKADGALIEWNRVDSIGYIGIRFNGSNVTVRNNFVTNFCTQKIDGGGIYTWFGPGARSNRTNQKVYNNIVMNGVGTVAGTTQSIPLVEGFYMDDGTASVELYGNTAANNSYSGFFIHNDSVMSVHDNTSYNNGVYQSLITSYTTQYPLRHLTFKNNILFARTATQKVASYESGANDILSFGTSLLVDSNHYVRPLDDNLTIQTIVNGNIGTQRNFAQWKTYSGYSSRGSKSPASVTNVSQISFYYNPTDHDSTVSVINGIDVEGTVYGGTTILHSFTSLILIATGALTIPVITYPAPSNITYGTPLSATELNASTGVAGSFSYSISGVPITIGQILPAGTYTINWIFTPSDPTTYTGVSGSVPLTVLRAPATISVPNSTVTYNSLQQSPVVTTFPAGLATTSLFNGLSIVPYLPNTYTVVTGVTDVNYIATPVTSTFTISKGSASITASDSSVNYDGLTHTIVASTNPPGRTLVYTYDGSSTPSSTVGPHTVVISMPADSFYTASSVTVTLTINLAAASIFNSNLSQPYNTFTRPITVTTNPAGLAHTTSYNGVFTAPIASGTYTVISTITDGIHTGSDTDTYTITKVNPVITWIKPQNIPLGTIISPAINNATANVPGVFIYTPPNGATPNVGTLLLSVQFIPTDPNYNTVTKTTSVTIIGNTKTWKYYYWNGTIFYIKY